MNESITDTGDEKTQKMGLRLVNGLMQQAGIGPAMAVLTVAWINGALAILHATSPLPETNIQSLNALVDSMHSVVEGHEDCAMQRGQGVVTDEDGEIANPTVH